MKTTSKQLEQLFRDTVMHRALAEGTRRVRLNIERRLASDHAKEEAIALFRVARCIIPDQEEDRWRHR